MSKIMKASIILLAVGVLFIKPTSSYAWGHGGDHFRLGLNLSVPLGGYYGDYYSPYYYSPDSVYLSSPSFQPVVVNGTTYYVNNGNYYVYTGNGYQVVSPPVTVIQSPQIVTTAPLQVTSSINASLDDSFSINIPNDKGGYTAVVLKQSGNGFTGPQGEFYSEFPKVSQLKIMYGK